MNQFSARVMELREKKYVKYDGKITMDSPPREFLEVTRNFDLYPPYVSVVLHKIFIFMQKTLYKITKTCYNINAVKGGLS